MDIVAAAWGLSRHQLTEMGACDSTARELADLAAVYFAPTPYSRLQREARDAAAARGHSLPVLQVIETYARRLKHSRLIWTARHELTALDVDLAGMKKAAAAVVKRLRTPRPPKSGVTMYRRPSGVWTLAITGPAARLADLFATIDQDKPLDSVEEKFLHSCTTSALSRPPLVSHVVINLEQLGALVTRPAEDCADIELQMTNGATITGAQLVERTLADVGLVTVVDPVAGPVNVYRTQRMATAKQRLMAMAENPVCPGPGCNQPADVCQVHHIQAWAKGGMTNMENLSILCRYHNGVNDDDPTFPRRGRVERVDGTICWVFPWADPAPV